MADPTGIHIKLQATGGKESAEREIRPMDEAAAATASSLDLMAEAAAKLAESPESLRSMKEAAAQLADAARAMREEMEASGETAEHTAAALAPIEEMLNGITDAIVAREEAEAEETARLQAEAYEAEAAALRELEAAYEAAQVAAAEAAVAEDEAAEAIDRETEATKASTAEQRKKQEALGKMHSALDRLIPGYGRVRQQVNGLREAWRASGAEGRSFGGRLVAMAGGPVGIGIAAFTALVGVVAKWRQRMRELDAEIARLGEPLDGLTRRADAQKTVWGEAASEAGKYSSALNQAATEMEARKAAWEGEIDRLNELAAAQRLAAKAAIDLAVARGEMSSEEGAVRKGELEIDALRRELATAQVKAANDKAVADAELRQAKAAERAARDELARTQAEVEDQVGRQGQFDDRRKSLQTQAAQVRTKGISEEGIIEALGGPEEVLRRLSALTGAAGWIAGAEFDLADRAGMGSGSVIQSLLQSPVIRGALAEQLAAESATAERAALARGREIKQMEDGILEEQRKELAAVRAKREVREKEAAAAEAALGDAVRRRQLGMDYRIPAMEAGIETHRTKEQQRLERESQDAYDKGKKDFDRDAAGVAKDLGVLLQSRGPGAEQSETGKLIAHMIKALQDGTDYTETGWVASMLGTLSTSLEVSQAVRAELAEAQREILRLHAGFKVIQAQIRNNPNRG